MARIPPLDRDTAAPEARVLLDDDLEHYGHVLNSTAVAAYVPTIATAGKQLGRAVAQSRLIPEQLRLLINVRIASLVGCPF
ncbi:MAG TPA: hypothetical protein VEQ11_11805 [Chloroflexota bacterium]|nr:hypothetical protein [Chloroflexota bacterium]